MYLVYNQGIQIASNRNTKKSGSAQLNARCSKDDCVELKFVKKSGVDLMGAFKAPTLRNVAVTAPYMHSGQMADLEQVLLHYSRAPKSALGESHLVPVNLTADESAQLKAFLHTLGQ